MPTALLEPTTPQEAAFMLFDAGLQGRRIVPRGGGTKLAATNLDASTEAWMSTLSLRGALAHDPGDLVASVPAGMTLHEANWQLAQSGQWLPLDPPDADRATIGGIVATNDSGPRRHRYGAPRDLILGLELAMTDGRVAHALRADWPVAPRAADVRRAVGMPVAGRRRLRSAREAHSVPNNSIQLPSGSATNIQPMPGTGANSVTGSTTSYSDSPKSSATARRFCTPIVK